MSRKYKSGMRWAVWRWTHLVDEQLTRLHIVGTPYGSICIHWLHKPDPEPHPHDHPVTFLALILRGKYVEMRKRKNETVYKYVTRRWFNWIVASIDDRHTIIEVAPNTITLCFMGPKTRTWGFHTHRGWFDWKTYYEFKHAGQDLPRLSPSQVAELLSIND